MEDKYERLNRAIHFAVDHHAGQTRKGNDTPYIVHPLEVLELLAAMHAGMDVMTAGVLHDTVEDTDAGIEDIRESFGDDIAELVGAHTEDKSKTWQERKDAAIAELDGAPAGLKCLVLADKLSNIRDMERELARVGDKIWDRFHAPKEKQKWFYQENLRALAELKDDPNTAEFYNELEERYHRIFDD